jgi:hypothetical protein
MMKIMKLVGGSLAAGVAGYTYLAWVNEWPLWKRIQNFYQQVEVALDELTRTDPHWER